MAELSVTRAGTSDETMDKTLRDSSKTRNPATSGVSPAAERSAPGVLLELLSEERRG